MLSTIWEMDDVKVGAQRLLELGPDAVTELHRKVGVEGLQLIALFLHHRELLGREPLRRYEE